VRDFYNDVVAAHHERGWPGEVLRLGDLYGQQAAAENQDWWSRQRDGPVYPGRRNETAPGHYPAGEDSLAWLRRYRAVREEEVFVRRLDRFLDAPLDRSPGWREGSAVVSEKGSMVPSQPPTGRPVAATPFLGLSFTRLVPGGLERALTS